MRRDQGTKNLTMAHLHALSKSEEYRGLFDAVIAPDRGWSSVVLRTIDPGTFDKRIDERSPYGPMIADLIDYRLRAVLNGRTIDEANISHAVFFNWWPSKARPSPRTRFTWWKLLKRTSVFIHLVEKHGFPMRPPKLNDGDFIDSLLNPGISQARLRSFFSQYAFIIEQLQDESFVSIAATPTPIKVKPFSNEERGTIEDYKDHYLEMN